MSTQPTASHNRTASSNLNRRAGLYALAAATAGVTLLALTEPAAGEVVVTKKTVPIPLSPADMPNLVKISMANNGVDNIVFNFSSNPPGLGNPSYFRNLDVGGASSNAGAVLSGTFIAYTPALRRGAKVGPSAYFSEAVIEQSITSGGNASPNGFVNGFRGYWGGNPKDRYVGVRFQIDGQTHFGWVRLTVTTHASHHPVMSATITAYAYETVANKPILAGTAATSATELQAPENSKQQVGPSLGMLADGTEALPLWRREATSALP